MDKIVFGNQSRKTEEHHLVAQKSLILHTADIELRDLTFDMVRQWKNKMQARNLSSETIRGYLIKLRNVLRYMRLLEIPCMNYEFIELEKKRKKRIVTFLNPEEITMLIDACDVTRSRRINRLRNKAVIALLFSSGIRNKELCEMNISDVKYDSFTIWGKGGDAAPSYIDARARKLIDDYLEARTDNNEALFVNGLNDLRVTPDNVREILKYARKNAGINVRATPHTLRHSFGTDLMRNGADIRHVQALMHHSDIQTTQVYLHVIDNELEALHKKYHTSS